MQSFYEAFQKRGENFQEFIGAAGKYIAIHS
jgi:hypothetical protein